MPQRDPAAFLEDIEHYASAALRFLSGYTLEQYLGDEKTRAAVKHAPALLAAVRKALKAFPDPTISGEPPG